MGGCLSNALGNVFGRSSTTTGSQNTPVTGTGNQGYGSTGTDVQQQFEKNPARYRSNSDNVLFVLTMNGHSFLSSINSLHTLSGTEDVRGAAHSTRMAVLVVTYCTTVVSRF